jgi:hypothetical protein
MIEESVKNANGGVKITEEVVMSLGQIVNRTGKVGSLIAEIAAASSEQAQGIEQVAAAVAQMNQVTQRNAANSEESASAAEELNNQAAELANMVGSFKLSGGAEPYHAALSTAPTEEDTAVEVAAVEAELNIPQPSPQKRHHVIHHHNTRTAGKTTHHSLHPLTKSVRTAQAREMVILGESEFEEILANM